MDYDFRKRQLLKAVAERKENALTLDPSDHRRIRQLDFLHDIELFVMCADDVALGRCISNTFANPRGSRFNKDTQI